MCLLSSSWYWIQIIWQESETFYIIIEYIGIYVALENCQNVYKQLSYYEDLAASVFGPKKLPDMKQW